MSAPQFRHGLRLVVMIAQHLTTTELLEAITHQVRLVRGRFGSYEPVDFHSLLFGFAISGQRTLSAFFERVTPFASAFMALFGRADLPHRATLSRFLASVDSSCLEAFRTLFEQNSFAQRWTEDSIGGIWDRQRCRSMVFDVDATRQAARQRALPCDPTLPSPRRRLDEVCAPGYARRANEGKLFVHAPLLSRCIPANGLEPMPVEVMGTTKVNLHRHARAITTYLQLFALPPQVALVRLDGQYGDTVALTLLIEAGVFLLTRGRSYLLLDHPHLQRVLAPPPTARVIQVCTNEEVELFEGGWLSMKEGMPQVRIIVARHRVPESSKRVSVGKRISEWVYEIFITTLPTEGFLVEDVLDLYHGRGAFEAVLADEDAEEDG